VREDPSLCKFIRICVPSPLSLSASACLLRSIPLPLFPTLPPRLLNPPPFSNTCSLLWTAASLFFSLLSHGGRSDGMPGPSVVTESRRSSFPPLPLRVTFVGVPKAIGRVCRSRIDRGERPSNDTPEPSSFNFLSRKLSPPP